MEPNNNSTRDSRQEDHTVREKPPVRRILLTCLHVILTVLPVVACGTAIYLHAVYPNEKLEELWFYLSNGAGDSGSSTFLKGAAAAPVRRFPQAPHDPAQSRKVRRGKGNPDLPHPA